MASEGHSFETAAAAASTAATTGFMLLMF